MRNGGVESKVDFGIVFVILFIEGINYFQIVNYSVSIFRTKQAVYLFELIEFKSYARDCFILLFLA